MRQDISQKNKLVAVFFGMTAAGKSFLSSAWAKQHGIPRFNTDVVRKRVIAMEQGLDNRGGSGIDQGLYAPEFSRLTYERLLQLAKAALQQENAECVVLDGSFQRAADRDAVCRLFQHMAEVRFVLCSCSEDVVRQRLCQRQEDKNAVSDANLEVYYSQQRNFEPPEEIPAGCLLILDTDAPLGYLIDQLEQFLRPPLRSS